MLNRRGFIGGMAAGALLHPLAFAASRPGLDELYDRARPEGEVTWYIAYYRTEVAERVGAAFAQKYPGLKVNVVRATGQVIFQRLGQDLKAQSANCDVFSGTDTSHYEYLKQHGIYARYRPQALDEILPIVREAADPEDYFVATDTSMTLLVHHTEQVKEADIPRRWTDLADPRWKNQLALPHPGYSGAMGSWVVEMTERYGWEFIEKLAANKPLISRSLSECPVAIGRGERLVGMGPSSTIWSLAARGTPVAASAPEDGARLSYSASGVLEQAPHPNAARLFLEFLLSKECGEIAAEQYAIPIRPDVQPLPGVLVAGSVPGWVPNGEAVAAELPELTEKWRDLFGV